MVEGPGATKGTQKAGAYSGRTGGEGRCDPRDHLLSGERETSALHGPPAPAGQSPQGESGRVTGIIHPDVKLLLDTLDAHLRGLREAMVLCDASQRHEDNMVVWIIGLATGAVIAIPSLMGQVVPRWAIAVSIAPFVLAVLSGVVHRLLLAALMTHDDYFGLDKILKVEALRLRAFGSKEDTDAARIELLSIMDSKPPGLAKRKQTVDVLNWWTKRLSFLPYILFGIGVLVTAIIAVSSS